MLMSDLSMPESKSLDDTIRTSLIGPFSIAIHKNKIERNNDENKDQILDETWNFYRIDSDAPSDVEKGVGAIALGALKNASHKSRDKKDNAVVMFEVKCRVKNVESTSINLRVDLEWKNVSEISEEENEYNDLKAVSQIILFRAINEGYQKIEKESSQFSSMKIMIYSSSFPSSFSFPSELNMNLNTMDKQTLGSSKIQQQLCSKLFDLDDASTVELSDMVDSNGDPIAVIPRTLVHKHNILHRGVGIVVSKNDHVEPVGSSKMHAEAPMVYVHRRTDTKRIFPSLYDMFVGGVSLTGEEAILTAAREVGEELGLVGALKSIETEAGIDLNISKDDILRGPLFKCTVCTGYNRCVVTVFSYRVDVEKESFQWQEEEVSWGGFVPYEIVEEAGNLSIDRLKETKTWPGEYTCTKLSRNNNELKERKLDNTNQDWDTWDFVPDGLLVWEAWQEWYRQD